MSFKLHFIIKIQQTTDSLVSNCISDEAFIKDNNQNLYTGCKFQCNVHCY